MTTQLWATRNSPIHGKGVFASCDIKKGTHVIQYVGEKITKKESDRRADKVLDASKKNKTLGAVYIFDINSRYDIDGNVSWNPARHINHSCDPNCESVNVDGEIWIEALRDIKKGEELSYNYGYGWDEDFDEHECRCGATNCVGFILDTEHWKRLRNIAERVK